MQVVVHSGDLGSVFEWVWTASHAMSLHEQPEGPDPEVTGTLEEALAVVKGTTRALPA